MVKKANRRAGGHNHSPLQRELSVTWTHIGSVKPNPRNARTHSKRQVKALARCIDTFGWTKPLVTGRNEMIIAGHGCFEAAKLLGLKEVPVIRRADLTQEQIRLYALADNQLAQLSGWDTELLAIELKELVDLGLDVSLTGFEPLEIESLLDDFFPRNDSEDDIALNVADGPTISRTGDLFLLGNHRLLCGDATHPNDVQLLLGGAEPVLMVADPPYGVNYDPAWRKNAGLKSTAARSRRIRNDDRANWQDAWELFPGDVTYVWHAGVHTNDVYQSLVKAGFEIRAQIIWVKNRFAIGRGDYQWAHEPAFYAVRKGRSANWHGNRRQTTVWQIAPISDHDQGTVHPTQKRFGGLSATAQRLLRNASGPAAANRVSAAPTLPKRGTLLTREWKGVVQRVQVLDRGFAHNGIVYTSLSEVARVITGTRWSGPRFFGLSRNENGQSHCVR